MIVPADPRGVLADTIAVALRQHPAVLRLDAGRLGLHATHLPGRKVDGVRVTDVGDSVEIGVVLRPTGHLPSIVDELRALIRPIAGDVAVAVEVTDVGYEKTPRVQNP